MDRVITQNLSYTGNQNEDTAVSAQLFPGAASSSSSSGDDVSRVETTLETKDSFVVFLNPLGDVVRRSQSFVTINDLRSPESTRLATQACFQEINVLAFASYFRQHPFVQPLKEIRFQKNTDSPNEAASQSTKQNKEVESSCQRNNLKSPEVLDTVLEFCGPTLEAYVPTIYGQEVIPQRNVITALPFMQFVLSIMYQLLRVFQDLSAKGIIHADCSPHRVLYNPETFRVRIAHSSAIMFHPKLAKQTVQISLNPHYDPPECLSDGAAVQVDSVRNVWSVGMIAVFILARCHPGKIFSDDACLHANDKESYQKHLFEYYERQRKSGRDYLSLEGLAPLIKHYLWAQPLFDIIERMLTIAPQKRPSFSSVLADLLKLIKEFEFNELIIDKALPFTKIVTDASAQLIYLAGQLISTSFSSSSSSTQRPPVDPTIYLRKFDLERSDRVIALVNIADLARATQGESCFILGTHIWEHYCMSRKNSFRSSQEYQAAGFVAQFIAWGILKKSAYDLAALLDRCCLMLPKSQTMDAMQMRSLHEAIQWIFQDLIITLNGGIYMETFDQKVIEELDLNVCLKLLMLSSYYKMDSQSLSQKYREIVLYETSEDEGRNWWQRSLMKAASASSSSSSNPRAPIQAPKFPDLPSLCSPTPASELLARNYAKSPGIIEMFYSERIRPSSSRKRPRLPTEDDDEEEEKKN